MTFVRRHMFIIVVLTAIAAAGLTDLLTGLWAQHGASGNIDNLGWFMSPLVQNSNGSGSVATFVALWLFCLLGCAVILRFVTLFKREIAHVQD